MVDFPRSWKALGVGAALIAAFGAGFGVARLNAPSPVGAVVAGATSKGAPWPGFGKPRSADAPRAEPQRPEGFAVWSNRRDTATAAPSACIRMTEPLDPRRRYEDFVTVTPSLAHPVSVNVSGDELCIQDVGYEPRTVTLLRGLPSKSGATLAEAVEVAIATAGKPPYVGFAGTGVILPRLEADGVALETVNVSRLHMTVWRVPDRNLVQKEIRTSDPVAEGEWSYEDGPQSVGDQGRKVWEGDLAVRGTTDQRATTVFPLGAVLKKVEPGAYRVEARDASGVKGEKPNPDSREDTHPARASRWILFTDMALQAYSGADALDVTVQSLKSARPLANVRLALVAKDGEDLGAAQSDANGRVRFPKALLKGEGGAGPARVMAYGPHDDFTLIDLERAPLRLPQEDVTGRTPPNGPDAVDGFLYADRGIYRPNETVHLVGLLRDHTAMAVTKRKGALVIRRPSGLEFARLTFDATPGGEVAKDVHLPAGAARGVWSATLQIEGEDAEGGQLHFDVEDFIPQRLAVALEANADHPITAGETRHIGVNARFLYGAVAQNLQVQTETRVVVDKDPFPQFKDYRFGDEKSGFDEPLLQSPGDLTDTKGDAHALLNLVSLGANPRPLRALVTTSVFEPGGRPVTEQAQLRVRLKPLYLGVKTTPGMGADPLQTFEIIGLDPEGRRKAVAHLHYRLIAERWTYDWYEQNGRWGWRGSSRDIPVAEGVMSVGTGGPARLERRLPWGDYRLELDDAASGARTVIRQSSGWGEPTEGIDAPDTLRIAPVRSHYRTGDWVEVHIQAPFAGMAQVAVATDRVLAMQSVAAPASGVTVRFRADAQWSGGAYILATVVQPRDPVASPKPRRALGLVYVPLETPGRRLDVAIASPAKVTGQEALAIPITVKGLAFGQKARVTLAAVDEGILRLTHHKNPDPAAWYFGKRALTLTYRDDYGRLLDPNLGAAGAVNFGGDEFGGAGLAAAPVKTVALWSGVVETDAGGHALIHLPRPDFNGQLRLVAVAWTANAVGSGINSLISREPVAANLTLPRFLAPGDKAFATLELHNVDARAGAFRVSLAGRNGPSLAWNDTVSLGLGQRLASKILLTAPDHPVQGEAALGVSGQNLNIAHTYPVQVRPGWGLQTRVETALQAPNTPYTPSPGLLSGFAAGGVTVSVSYSAFGGLDPAPVAAMLQRYPYGCTEQLSSVGRAALFELASGGDRNAASRALAAEIEKLSDREALDGSFGLWRIADGEAPPWLGAYAIDFLLDAKAAGVSPAQDVLSRAVFSLQALARPDGFGSLGYQLPSNLGRRETAEDRAARDRAQSRTTAYALYDLVKAGHGDLARLRWFHDVGFQKEPSPLARAQIGAALAAMGDKGRAKDSFDQAEHALGFRDIYDPYQSPLRDLAGLVALASEAGDMDRVQRLQNRLIAAVKAPDSLNTQEAAFLLKAAAAMARRAGPISVQANGASPTGAARWMVSRLAGATFTNRSRSGLWRTVTVTGVMRTPPRARSDGMLLTKTYFRETGTQVGLDSVKLGDRLIVRLSGRATSQREVETLIDDALPGGFEIEQLLTPEDAQGAAQPGGQGQGQGAAKGPFAFLGQLSTPSVQEKRDDRYVAALKLRGGVPFTLAYVVRAVTAGDFFLPGALAQDMYHPAVAAQTAAGRLRIAPGS